MNQLSAQKAPLKEKIGYGFGDLASSMFWKIFSYFIPFFYVDIFGLRPEHAFMLILLTKVYDAVSDPVMGMIADRTQTKWGKYRPYLLWIAIPFAVCGILMFYTPSGSYAFKHVYAYVTYLLMMTAYTAINVPYGAMLGVVSDDSKEKNLFSSFRMAFAYIGSFVSMGIFAAFEEWLKTQPRIVNGAPMLDADGNAVLVQTVKEAQPMQFTTVVAIVAILSLIFFVLSFVMTREHVKIERPKSGSKGSILNDLKSLICNGPWWLLTVASISLLMVGSLRGGAAVYYFSNIMGSNALFGTVVFLTIGEVAQLAGVLLAVPLSSRVGRRTTAILSLLWIGLFSVPVSFLPGTAAGFWGLFACHILVCIGIGTISPMLWAMFSDVADYTEERDGVASTGLVFSSSSMAQKFGAAFGTALVSGILAIVGYETGVNENSHEINLAIRAMMGYLPTFFAVAGVGLMLLYPLTTKRMADIQAKLAQRRSAQK